MKSCNRMRILQICVVSSVIATSAVVPSAHAEEPAAGPARAVEVRPTSVPPRIDGSIEPLWYAADSTSGFIQSRPYEKSPPTERTVVYMLEDNDNLYVAFRCHSLKHPPTANLTKDEDYVSISFDPFGSRTTGYFFLVYGSGLFWDGLILDDGRDQDLTWEGVWFRAVKIYPDRMEVEMKIPFKTIRYEKGLADWGLQFQRHIASNFEDNYWTEVTEKEGDLVSRWGVGRGIRPRSSGYYFELYPEGFLRYDDYAGKKGKTKPKGSLNLKWDLTPQTSLNATAYPDFAQIESDPFSVNLSRYPTYLQEQRPFFIEGTEIFHMSGFPNSGFFQPLNIFYSRRIGKSLDGEAVPILTGMKLTHKTETWNIGALGAATDAYRKSGEGIDEPARSFGAFRARRRVLGNSDVGVLAAGMSRNSRDYDYAIAGDAALRKGANQWIVQGARSDHNGKSGWAVSSGYRGFVRNLLTMAAYEAVGDSFDVQDIGFVPWAGRQRAMVISGPFWTFQGGALRNFYVAPGIIRGRDPGSPHWSTMGHFTLNPNFRRRWGLNLEMSYGRNYELNDLTGVYQGYIGRSLDLNFYGLLRGNVINGGGSYGYSYNYARHYLGYQGFNYLTVSYSFIPPLSATLSSNLWVEWDPNRKVVAMWPLLRPRLDCRLSPYMTLSVFDELVAYAPGTKLTQSRLQSDRVGLLYSWNFAPKSWLYAALNDYSALDYRTNPAGTMKRQYAIGAVKLKYLLYF